MNTSTFITEEQLITTAIDALLNALGPVETSRFLTLPKKTRVESVERHQRWQATLKKDEFFGRIFLEEAM